MGTLKCYEWIENEDGTKTSAAQGLVVNGVILGNPLELDGDPATAEFDDGMFPNGEILADGTIIPDEPVELEAVITPEVTAEIPFVEETIIEEPAQDEEGN